MDQYFHPTDLGAFQTVPTCAGPEAPVPSDRWNSGEDHSQTKTEIPPPSRTSWFARVPFWCSPVLYTASAAVVQKNDRVRTDRRNRLDLSLRPTAAVCSPQTPRRWPCSSPPSCSQRSGRTVPELSSTRRACPLRLSRPATSLLVPEKAAHKPHCGQTRPTRTPTTDRQRISVNPHVC